MMGELACGGEEAGRYYASLWSLRFLSIAFIWVDNGTGVGWV